MDLPRNKQHQAYIHSIKELEEIFKRTMSGDVSSDINLGSVQNKLDAVAEKYQNNDTIGAARYKLYELQAFIYYFEHKDNEALNFINQAIETRGSSYTKAENLKFSLSKLNEATIRPSIVVESEMTKIQKRKKLIGVEGWLAIFILGLFLAAIQTVYNFFSSGFISSSDTESLNAYQSGLGDKLQTVVVFESFAILAYVTLIIITLVLLFRRSKLAKPFAIITLLFFTIYGSLDYAITSSMFTSDILNTVEMQKLMTKYAGEIGKGVIAALIWIPYFLISKRVKATLTK